MICILSLVKKFEGVKTNILDFVVVEAIHMKLQKLCIGRVEGGPGHVSLDRMFSKEVISLLRGKTDAHVVKKKKKKSDI